MEHPSNIIVFSIFLGQNSRTMFLWKYPEDKNVPTNRLLTNYTQKLFSYYKHKTWKSHSKCSVIMVNESDGVLIFGSRVGNSIRDYQNFTIGVRYLNNLVIPRCMFKRKKYFGTNTCQQKNWLHIWLLLFILQIVYEKMPNSAIIGENVSMDTSWNGMC